MDKTEDINFEDDIEINDSDSDNESEIENIDVEEDYDETKKEDEEEDALDEEDEEDEKEEEDEEEELDDVNVHETNIINDAYYEDSENDDDLDEDYLQKIDKDTQSSIVQNYHPEMIVHNHDEIKTSCQIVRDSQGNIIDPLHKTLPFVTCYEKARVIGERSKQIEAGAKPFIEVASNVIDSYLIALEEFEKRKIPFIIQRPLPNGQSEYWKLSDLEII